MQEISIDYTHCRTEIDNSTGFKSIPSKYVSSSFKSDASCSNNVSPKWQQSSINLPYTGGTPVNTSVCSLQFTIPSNLKPPVLFYYRLTNFYQNHRRYVKSLDSDQLQGNAVHNDSLGSCKPLDVDHNGKPYWPCGLIANSFFNDTFSNPLQLNAHDSSAQNITYNMTDTGIAWSSDKSLYGPTKYNVSDIVPPRNWYLRYQDGYTSDNLPNLANDEAFQVWMRTAGLPNFSKLAKRNDNETMQCSTYQVDIQNSRSFTSFGFHTLKSVF